MRNTSPISTYASRVITLKHGLTRELTEAMINQGQHPELVQLCKIFGVASSGSDHTKALRERLFTHRREMENKVRFLESILTLGEDMLGVDLPTTQLPDEDTTKLPDPPASAKKPPASPAENELVSPTTTPFMDCVTVQGAPHNVLVNGVSKVNVVFDLSMALERIHASLDGVATFDKDFDTVLTLCPDVKLTVAQVESLLKAVMDFCGIQEVCKDGMPFVFKARHKNGHVHSLCFVGHWLFVEGLPTSQQCGWVPNPHRKEAADVALVPALPRGQTSPMDGASPLGGTHHWTVSSGKKASIWPKTPEKSCDQGIEIIAPENVAPVPGPTLDGKVLVAELPTSPLPESPASFRHARSPEVASEMWLAQEHLTLTSPEAVEAGEAPQLSVCLQVPSPEP